MTTIPASAIVNVTPSVLAAGGDALDLIGLLLTQNTRVPIGTVQAFASAAEVDDFFGPSSGIATLAPFYFNGFDGSGVKPGSLLVAQYPSSAVGAYLRGGDVSALSLSELQAISGTLSVTIDGVVKSDSPNLATATSFSSAASIIGSALSIQGPQVATFNASISGTTLSVGTMTTGTLGVGVILSGTGVVAGTYITALGTGTGGVGTYTVSQSQTAVAAAMTGFAPAVTYDSVSGGFIIVSPTTGSGSTLSFGTGAISGTLKLTSATGAVLSQGAGAATVASFMTSIVNLTQDWASFFLDFDPDAGVGNTQKLAFSAWNATQNNRYAFICPDTDASPATSVPASASLGALIAAAGYSGTVLIYSPSGINPTAAVAAFLAGSIASLDFEETNGRATMAFRTQSGLVAEVTDDTTASNLIANGYNFYGAYATANQGFVFFYPGSISGPFAWADSYVDEIWLNNSLQLSLMELLTQNKSIPYNQDGLAQIETGLADPINAGINFGAIRAGVTLSSSQITAVNNAAKKNIAQTLQQRGWYLDLQQASPTVRQARESPPCTFYYVDGQSVQKINLSSVELA